MFDFLKFGRKMQTDKGHSEEYFRKNRDYWWNYDFLELMARRLRLHECHKILDVGCGQCHWSRLLITFMSKPAEVHGLDKDPKWCVLNGELTRFFSKQDTTITLKLGDAQDLPYDTSSFDIVTCQTTLIHVQYPQKALSEMCRVVKPGGLVLCVEPNNIAGSLFRSSLSSNATIEETINDVKYALLYERGKMILGEGDNSYGDLLSEHFFKAGLSEIQVYLSDKASPLQPPYESQEQQAILNDIDEWNAEGVGPYNWDETQRYIKAFGNRYSDCLDEMQKRSLAETTRFRDAVKSGQYFYGGAAIMYLVSGRKVEATSQDAKLLAPVSF